MGYLRRRIRLKQHCKYEGNGVREAIFNLLPSTVVLSASRACGNKHFICFVVISELYTGRLQMLTSSAVHSAGRHTGVLLGWSM